MYYQSALKPRYISANLIPQFTRLKYDVDDTIKRSIFDEDDYDFYERYLRNVYVTKKHNPTLEKKDLLVRKIFYQFIFIMSNCGCRSKELLTLKLNDINFNLQQYGNEINEKCVEITIRKEVSKTGKSRKLIAPVKKKFINLFKIYKELNINHEPYNYIFLNPNSKKDKACTKTGHNTVQTCLENAKCVDDNQKKQSNDINIMIQSITRKIHKYLFKKIIFNIIRFNNRLSIINFHVSL